MSQVFDLCEGSDDNGEWPNAASVPPLPLSRKRRRDREEASNDANHRNENGLGNKTATSGWAKFVFDLELADEMEVGVSLQNKRRSLMKSDRSAKNDAAGKIAQTLKEIHATEKEVDSEDAQVVDHDESHEGITSAASYPMNSDSEQTSRDDGSANKHSQKRLTSKLSRPFESKGTAWDFRLSELADYRKVHRHCNVPQKYSENAKLGAWVGTQRGQYRLHLKGKTSTITLPRIEALESLGFEWCSRATCPWEDRLIQLADYRKVHGHCNVPGKYSENVKLGTWVVTQRYQYGLHLKGKASPISLPRIQALESLGFEWGSRGATCPWEDRLSALANYRKVHGHCNVPQRYSENVKLGRWVAHQRHQYNLHVKGKASPITLPRIEALESLGFEWGSRGATCPWEDRLSELANYRKVHGHSNVPQKYSENAKLGTWVATQRYQCSLHLKGETSKITLPRIQALIRLGFEWKTSISRRQETMKKANLDVDVTSARERAVESLEKSAVTAGDSAEANTRDDASQAKLPCLAHQRKTINSFSHARLVAGPPENNFSVAAKKLARSRQVAESQLETALSNKMLLRTNPVAPAEPLQQRHNNLVGNGSTRNNVHAIPDKSASAPQDMTHLKGKTSPITLPRIQALESLDFEWGSCGTAWEFCLSELAEYRKVHGHCNVPKGCSENAKLRTWVVTQRHQYRFRLEGKTSLITLPRIQALESLGFEWSSRGAPCIWEDRLSELADYRKVHGHCNVPQKYSENVKLGTWVAKQRSQYRLHQEGKTSQMTLPRIQALIRLGFEWKTSISRWQETLKKSKLDDDVTSARERTVESTFSHAHLAAGPPENNFLVAAKKPANLRQGAKSQLEMVLSNKPASAPQDMMQQTPRDEVFQSDNVLREELV
jgi:hypothetical protein